jgi:citrate synthase
MHPWRTAIVTSDATNIWIRGHEITRLMRGSTFTDAIALLHRGRLPSPAERRLLDAILIGVCDHGAGAPSCAAARLAASGNRQSVSGAVAAGILTIGDEHGGAASNCMELIAASLAAAKKNGETPAEAARRAVADAIATKRRLPGLGHRVHTHDRRSDTLFDMARAEGLAGDGIAFMEALAAETAAKIRPMALNIDGSLAAVLHDMGFPPLFGRFLFIIGRVAGLTAEVAEEYEREKPMRIKFDVEYDGPPPITEPTERTNAVREQRAQRSEPGGVQGSPPFKKGVGGSGGAKPPGK